ncbi:protein RRP6-like 2 isoform X2 [Carica papaya]|uniref:protein RRP6-like 2 isoform X2 n=1 Tax=Carica papaya TaxID=3649 RepID=UPI000B8CF996|nr:protein RRP6-like 2 isoform X2 [Carica papaya]
MVDLLFSLRRSEGFGKASRVLKLERNSLEFLLQHFCGVTANKEYQHADWRLRPLPDEMVRYAREDTHYLLYIYDIMKIRLHALSKEPEKYGDPLVEVYKRSYDICFQLYEKELLTQNSFLNTYGLLGADLNAQQLAIVSGLCEWRDIIARMEDESTGYILPNRTLLEIAKQMPTTAGKLHRLIKPKHPYIERNLASVVSIIKNSLQNAAAFEAVAQQLKEEREETASEEKKEAGDGSEVVPSEPRADMEAANAIRESISSGTEANDVISVPISASPTTKEKSLQLGGAPQLPAANGKVKIESDSYTSKVPGGSFTNSGQRNSETPTRVGLSLSLKVSAAIVQASKQPSRGFGALLGNAASKRKFGIDKDKEEMKLEQIRSSVNLPFHSFSGKDSQLKSVADNKVMEIPQSKQLSPVSVPDSKVEDIIMLEDNQDDAQESKSGVSEATDTPREEKSVGCLKLEDEDEPMSLSDLSSSFKKCFQSLNQNRKAGTVDKCQERGDLLQLKPFDYEAARKQVKFGEDAEKGSGSGDSEKQKKTLDSSSGRKKSSVVGQIQRGDETSEFSQGKRRQAFPASGNRSATFL